jgi:hypothetical protein
VLICTSKMLYILIRFRTQFLLRTGLKGKGKGKYKIRIKVKLKIMFTL